MGKKVKILALLQLFSLPSKLFSTGTLADGHLGRFVLLVLLGMVIELCQLSQIQKPNSLAVTPSYVTLGGLRVVVCHPPSGSPCLGMCTAEAAEGKRHTQVRSKPSNIETQFNPDNQHRFRLIYIIYIIIYIYIYINKNLYRFQLVDIKLRVVYIYR